MATILRVFWIHLRRDRVVWLLTFIVPVAFFSIFALILGGQGKNSTPTVSVAVVDEDHSDFSKKLITSLNEEKSLHVTTTRESTDGDAHSNDTRLSRHDAQTMAMANYRWRSFCPRVWVMPFPVLPGTVQRSSSWQTLRTPWHRKWSRGSFKDSYSRRRPTRC